MIVKLFNSDEEEIFILKEFPYDPKSPIKVHRIQDITMGIGITKYHTKLNKTIKMNLTGNYYLVDDITNRDFTWAEKFIQQDINAYGSLTLNDIFLDLLYEAKHSTFTLCGNEKQGVEDLKNILEKMQEYINYLTLEKLL